MQYYEKSLKMQQHEWIIINFLEGRDKQDRADLILPGGSLTVKKAKNTKIIGLQFGRTNFCSYLCSNTRYYLSRVFANL